MKERTRNIAVGVGATLTIALLGFLFFYGPFAASTSVKSSSVVVGTYDQSGRLISTAPAGSFYPLAVSGALCSSGGGFTGNVVVSLSSSSGSSGSPVTVSGCGDFAGDAVSVTGLSSCGATVSSTYTWSCLVYVPNVAAGTYTVKATEGGKAAGDYASASFTVTGAATTTTTTTTTAVATTTTTTTAATCSLTGIGFQIAAIPTYSGTASSMTFSGSYTVGYQNGAVIVTVPISFSGIVSSGTAAIIKTLSQDVSAATLCAGTGNAASVTVVATITVTVSVTFSTGSTGSAQGTATATAVVY